MMMLAKIKDYQLYWDALGDIPINEDEEILTEFNIEDIITFPIFTNRFEIWHWFEEYFNISIVKDLILKK